MGSNRIMIQWTNFWAKSETKEKQAGAELGQAQVKLDDIVEVVVNVEVIGVVKVDVLLLVRVGGWTDETKLILIST